MFCWFAFACLSCGDDGLLDYVQVLHQFSFVALNSRWPRILICNYCFCNAIESVKRPGGSHEGVGRKKNTLARPSGTLCGTARGAREQQRLRTWIECPFAESVASRWPTRWVSGSLFWISCCGCDDAMHCRYGTETKKLRKHLNSSAGYFPTGRPVTMHAENFACSWSCY